MIRGMILQHTGKAVEPLPSFSGRVSVWEEQHHGVGAAFGCRRGRSLYRIHRTRWNGREIPLCDCWQQTSQPCCPRGLWNLEKVIAYQENETGGKMRGRGRLTAYNWKEDDRGAGRRRDVWAAGEHTSCKPAIISHALCHSVAQHMATLDMLPHMAVWCG